MNFLAPPIGTFRPVSHFYEETEMEEPYRESDNKNAYDECTHYISSIDSTLKVFRYDSSLDYTRIINILKTKHFPFNSVFVQNVLPIKYKTLHKSNLDLSEKIIIGFCSTLFFSIIMPIDAIKDGINGTEHIISEKKNLFCRCNSCSNQRLEAYEKLVNFQDDQSMS